MLVKVLSSINNVYCQIRFESICVLNCKCW